MEQPTLSVYFLFCIDNHESLKEIREELELAARRMNGLTPANALRCVKCRVR